MAYEIREENVAARPLAAVHASVRVGDGRRLFPERGQTHDLTLVESISTPAGVMLQTYRPAGRVSFENAG